MSNYQVYPNQTHHMREHGLELTDSSNSLDMHAQISEHFQSSSETPLPKDSQFGTTYESMSIENPSGQPVITLDDEIIFSQPAAIKKIKKSVERKLVSQNKHQKAYEKEQAKIAQHLLSEFQHDNMEETPAGNTLQWRKKEPYTQPKVQIKKTNIIIKKANTQALTDENEIISNDMINESDNMEESKVSTLPTKRNNQKFIQSIEPTLQFGPGQSAGENIECIENELHFSGRLMGPSVINDIYKLYMRLNIKSRETEPQNNQVIAAIITIPWQCRIDLSESIQASIMGWAKNRSYNPQCKKWRWYQDIICVHTFAEKGVDKELWHFHVLVVFKEWSNPQKIKGYGAGTANNSMTSDSIFKYLKKATYLQYFVEVPEQDNITVSGHQCIRNAIDYCLKSQFEINQSWLDINRDAYYWPSIQNILVNDRVVTKNITRIAKIMHDVNLQESTNYLVQLRKQQFDFTKIPVFDLSSAPGTIDLTDQECIKWVLRSPKTLVAQWMETLDFQWAMTNGNKLLNFLEQKRNICNLDSMALLKTFIYSEKKWKTEFVDKNGKTWNGGLLDFITKTHIATASGLKKTIATVIYDGIEKIEGFFAFVRENFFQNQNSNQLFQKGAFYVLSGQPNSGKTTMLNMLLKVWPGLEYQVENNFWPQNNNYGMKLKSDNIFYLFKDEQDFSKNEKKLKANTIKGLVSNPTTNINIKYGNVCIQRKLPLIFLTNDQELECFKTPTGEYEKGINERLTHDILPEEGYIFDLWHTIISTQGDPRTIIRLIWSFVYYEIWTQKVTTTNLITTEQSRNNPLNLI